MSAYPIPVVPALPGTFLHFMGFTTEGKTQKPGPRVFRALPVIAWGLSSGRLEPMANGPLDVALARFADEVEAITYAVVIEIGDEVYDFTDGHLGQQYDSFSAWAESKPERGGLTEKEWKDAVKAFRSDDHTEQRRHAAAGRIVIRAEAMPETPRGEIAVRAVAAMPALSPGDETPEEIAAARKAMDELRASGMIAGEPTEDRDEDDFDAGSLV